MPEVATTYAIPLEYRERGVRRYGFHGLSCESIVRQLREAGIRLPQRMVIAHLGSGCSVTALLAGRSIDTTMGLTPTGGVVMGTRPGDLDPGLVLYLLRQAWRESGGRGAWVPLETMLNRASGMVALSGLPNDMRECAEGRCGGRYAGCAGACDLYAECEEGDGGLYCADGRGGCDRVCGWDWGA